MKTIKIGMLSLLFAASVGVAIAKKRPPPPPPPPPPAVRTIYLVRHGNYAPDPKADEKLGPGLSPLGVAQAHLAGARLAGLPVHFDGLYASPLQRAKDTAAIIAGDFPGRGFTVVDDLAECTPPTRRAEIMKDEKPEALAACAAAIDRDFARFFVPAAGNEHSDLIVAHGNVIRYLVTRALGVETNSWLGMSIGHASITKVRIEANGNMQVIYVGDIGHIPPNLQTGSSGNGDKSLEIPALPQAP